LDADAARLLDAETGAEIQVFKGLGGIIDCSSLTSDGKQLATISRASNTVALWDVETGNLIKEFASHLNWDNAVAFSPDGK